jgi:hypothetical protein
MRDGIDADFEVKDPPRDSQSLFDLGFVQARLINAFVNVKDLGAAFDRIFGVNSAAREELNQISNKLGWLRGLIALEHEKKAAEFPK